MSYHSRRNSLGAMKSSQHNPGAGTTAAHRRGLGSEPAGGVGAVPGLSANESQQAAAPDDAAAPEVFEDLRRRNERRARLARLRRHVGR